MPEAMPGIGDPYWFEWSVGQSHLIRMLDRSSGIASVALQMSVIPIIGLDDVVVQYDNGDIDFIQVKHSRVEDTLTFGDLVGVDEKGNSLLSRMASAWLEARKRTKGKAKAILFTNRSAGRRHSPGNTSGTPPRPPLEIFYSALKGAVGSAKTLSSIDLGSADLNQALAGEWSGQLSSLKSAKDKLIFLQSFEIHTSNLSLTQMEADLKKQIELLFLVPAPVARDLMARLDSGLRQWATSVRKKEQCAPHIILS